ncbi:hypothetical protein VNO77_46916 [Canavalia gladiata]
MQYPLTSLLARLSTGTGRGFLVASFHTALVLSLTFIARRASRGVEIDKKKSGQKLKNASHTDGQQRRPSKADSGSFICKSPPQARDCPMKEKLAGCRGQEGRTPRVNPLQLRNAITH